MNPMPPVPDATDAELLNRARAGDRDAFGRFVSRHQVLVVSIAYSICGEFARSEDLAQEAFIAAWRQLDSLQDHTKFKAWLCGIVRNLALNLVRQRRSQRDSVTSVPESDVADTAPSPREQAVSREQSAIVWQALEKLPERYREPLILFYREQQSITRVSAALDLTEDVVKQRLVRGRALVRQDLEKVIERTLGFTTPGATFTMTLMASLPAAVTGAAAGAGAAGAKIGTLAKLAVGFPTLAASVLPMISALIGRKQALQMTRSADDRKFISRLWIALGGMGVLAGVIAIVDNRIALAAIHPLPIAGPIALPITFFLGPLAILAGIGIIAALGGRRYLAWARQTRMPPGLPSWRRKLWLGADRAFIYRSRATLAGVPLLDIHFGHSCENPLERGRAQGWIALGDTAYGVVFAAGGTAFGGIALGGLAIGLVSIGAVSVGVLGFGAFATGAVVDGWFASAGYLAFATFFAAGIEAASAAAAIARDVASGAVFAVGEHTSDTVAIQWRQTNSWAVFFASPYLPGLSVLTMSVITLLGANWLIRRPASKRLPSENR